jgi:hypothetical protein
MNNILVSILIDFDELLISGINILEWSYALLISNPFASRVAQEIPTRLYLVETKKTRT